MHRDACLVLSVVAHSGRDAHFSLLFSPPRLNEKVLSGTRSYIAHRAPRPSPRLRGRLVGRIDRRKSSDDAEKACAVFLTWDLRPCERHKGGPTPNFVSALRGQAEALPTAYVSELDDRTTRLGRATSYNMHGDGWSTCRGTPMEGEPMHGLDVESIFRGTGITSTTCVHDTRVVRTHAKERPYCIQSLMGSG